MAPSNPVLTALRIKSKYGAAGTATRRRIASGRGWAVHDVVCSSGPADRPFEERHDWVSVAVVLSGTFTYKNELGRSLLTPGALLLGGAGGCFTCGHDHDEGDRCLSFHFEPAYFEDIAAAAGARTMGFMSASQPARRNLAPLVARSLVAANRTVSAASPGALETLAIDLAEAAMWTQRDFRRPAISSQDERRVVAVVRHVEREFSEPCALSDLARLAGLSPYHFLRIFRSVAGLTPHQYLLRTRLRSAASELVTTDASVTNIALATGFGDLSNFTRSFRSEYGLSPSSYRASAS